MEKEILAALIGGGFTIIAAFIGLLHTRKSGRTKSNNERRIAGDWKGKVIQALGPEGRSAEFTIYAYFSVRKAHISGSAKLDYIYKGSATSIALSFTGVLKHERFLQLSYEDSDKKSEAFGSIIIELLPNGRSMNGHLLGFGSISRKLVSADVELWR